MEHELDPRSPLFNPDGTPYTTEQRFNFFENAKKSFLSSHAGIRNAVFCDSLPISEQLDMLWHELDSTGGITKEGTWFNAVKAIKESHPKDDSTYQKAVLDVIQLRNKGA